MPNVSFKEHRVLGKLADLSKKAKSKILTAGAIVSIGAMNAAAAGVTIGSDGVVSGDLDKSTFMGLAGVVVALLSIIFGVKKGLSLLR